MQLTKAQELMKEDGLPEALFKSQEERAKDWTDNPPKPMPAFNSLPKNATDQETLKLLAELEEQKKAKTGNRIKKMLDKKIDRTGQRWDQRTSKWVNENEPRKPMISITTNTRGSTKMTTKDYAEMNLAEMATAYNKISGKEPIKKFKDKATGLKRLAELTSKKNAEATVKKVAVATAGKLSDVVRKPQKAAKEGSENKRAAEFGARVGSFREKLIIALDESFKKQVKLEDLLKAVYGSKNNENAGALTMVLKGAQTTIDKNNLPYTLKKEKVEGEISYGLHSK